jgi:hypothetical protein
MSKTKEKKLIDVWECEFCDKEFNNEKSAIKHEKYCNENPKNDYWNTFFGWGGFAIVFSIFSYPDYPWNFPRIIGTLLAGIVIGFIAMGTRKLLHLFLSI